MKRRAAVTAAGGLLVAAVLLILTTSAGVAAQAVTAAPAGAAHGGGVPAAGTAPGSGAHGASSTGTAHGGGAPGNAPHAGGIGGAASNPGSATAAATTPAPTGPIEKLTERGPVKAMVKLEPAAPMIGDAITLTVEVVAEDGIELLMPEFGQSLDRFAIREFVPKESADSTGRTVSLQRYTLEPPLSGPQSIPPLLIEFIDRRPGQRPAPEGEDTYELITERIAFEVGSIVPQGAADDLKPERGPLAPLRERGPTWPWLVALLALSAAAVPIAWRRLAAARAARLRRSAWDIARARLDALVAKPRPADEQTIDAFFVELSAIIRNYLERRFELRAPELTTEEFLAVASTSPDLTGEHRAFLRDFLRRADMVKFARFIPSPADIETALGAASRFLDQTRESAAVAAMAIQRSPQHA